VLVASSGGINFYIGNNSEADGLTASVPGESGATGRCEEGPTMVGEGDRKRITASEQSDFWYRKGWGWIRDGLGGDLLSYI